MTTTSGITSTGSPAATTQSSMTQSLGKDDFLKLFVAQLQHQDPMNPMADGEFMGQMAQFSTLEQTTNIAVANEAMANSLGMGQSLSLLGRTVTYVDEQDVRHTGVVEKVVTEGGVAQLTISGVEGIDPSLIVDVAVSGSPAAATPAPATPQTTTPEEQPAP